MQTYIHEFDDAKQQAQIIHLTNHREHTFLILKQVQRVEVKPNQLLSLVIEN